MTELTDELLSDEEIESRYESLCQLNLGGHILTVGKDIAQAQLFKLKKLGYKSPEEVEEMVKDKKSLLRELAKHLKELLEETGRPTFQKEILYEVACKTLKEENDG